MSSFVVTDQTVNRILGFASMKATGNRLMSEPARTFYRAYWNGVPVREYVDA